MAYQSMLSESTPALICPLPHYNRDFAIISHLQVEFLGHFVAHEMEKPVCDRGFRVRFSVIANRKNLIVCDVEVLPLNKFYDFP